MKELTAAVVEAYEENGELKHMAKGFDMSPLKVRKLLITEGAYRNELSDKLNRLYKEGYSVKEIQTLTGLGRSSVKAVCLITSGVSKTTFPSDLYNWGSKLGYSFPDSEVKANVALNIWEVKFVF